MQFDATRGHAPQLDQSDATVVSEPAIFVVGIGLAVPVMWPCEHGMFLSLSMWEEGGSELGGIFTL